MDKYLFNFALVCVLCAVFISAQRMLPPHRQSRQANRIPPWTRQRPPVPLASGAGRGTFGAGRGTSGPNRGTFGAVRETPGTSLGNSAGRGTPLRSGEWSPGEPRRAFPGNPSVAATCLNRGCTGVGQHCVFWNSTCPRAMTGVPCTCRRGCMVDTLFIPLRQSRVVDRCNNVCTCAAMDGVASCTTRTC